MGGLTDRGTTVYVQAYVDGQLAIFHQAYAKYLGITTPVIIDHENGVGIDNRDLNLNIVSFTSNNRNIQRKGYSIKDGYFRVRVYVDGSELYIGRYTTELSALRALANAINKYYTNYKYNFLLDRRGDLDILDDKLTGKITAEEATFHHVMHYARDNAWYVYRYGLEDYFNSRGIQIPAFELDSQGYMIDVNTKERLCPFK